MRVLDALRRQTLDIEEWELLVIDNASSENVEDWCDVTWHPVGKVIREEEIGLTNARLRGVREARSSLMLFLDDDNEVFQDYLQEGLAISLAWPILGVWGGQWLAEYEEGIPEEWEIDRWSTHFTRDAWSNNYDWDCAPFGGGMFARRSVAERYSTSATKDPLKKLLDRKGGMLSSYGDFDIAFCACDMGLGSGRFLVLKLTHLIPASRTTDAYFLKLWEDSSYSEVLFRFSRGEKPAGVSRIDALVKKYKSLRSRTVSRHSAQDAAVERGKRRAIEFLKSQRLIA